MDMNWTFLDCSRLLAVAGTFVSGLAGDERLPAKLLARQTGGELQQAAWPVVHHDLLGLPAGVAGNQDDNADALAA
jgi:hypothetical protein